MKQPFSEHRCMEKSCGWTGRSHKIRDGIKCPKCNGPVMMVARGDDYTNVITKDQTHISR